MNTLTLLLRITHIVAGILWAGGAMIFFLFIEPSAKATAPEGQKFMGAMSLLTTLGGAALYYRLGSVNWSWMTTGPGIGFTIVALAGISAFALGMYWSRGAPRNWENFHRRYKPMAVQPLCNKPPD